MTDESAAASLPGAFNCSLATCAAFGTAYLAVSDVSGVLGERLLRWHAPPGRGADEGPSSTTTILG